MRAKQNNKFLIYFDTQNFPIHFIHIIIMNDDFINIKKLLNRLFN
jgi:hypothetical protein